MDISRVVYSDKPFTLGQRILLQKAGNGDWEAMAAYILARTNLVAMEAMNLDDDEASTIIRLSIEKALVMQRLAADLPKIDLT